MTAQSAKEDPERCEDFKPDSNADPFDLFQLREGDQLPLNHNAKKLKELRRWKFYEKYYEDFENLPYGVATAQRGWIEKDRVLNAQPVEVLLGFKG